MLHRFKERFGTAGLVVALLALVLALGGTALAASGALTGKQKKEVEKIAKKFQGTGPAGPQGAAGANGKDGANGTNGQAGAPGTDGKNVVTTTITNAGLEGHCTSVGGTKFQVEGSATKEYVCNGKNGTNGQTGFTETLPEGKTETGIWGSGFSTAEGRHSFPISFPIPLATAPADSDITIVGPTESSKPGCPGRGGGALPPASPADFEPTIPEADPGKFCIYLDAMEETEPVSVETSVKIPVWRGGEWWNESGVSPTGALFEVICKSSFCQAFGTWAVTAPPQ
jgi:hypothetical protein